MFICRQILSVVYYFSEIFFKVCFRTCLLNWYLVYQEETAGSVFGLFYKSHFSTWFAYYLLLKRAGWLSSLFVDRDV